MGISSYTMGYVAREQGIPKDKNPFPSIGNWYKNWEKGWEHADADIGPIKVAAKVFSLKLVQEKSTQ